MNEPNSTNALRTENALYQLTFGRDNTDSFAVTLLRLRDTEPLLLTNEDMTPLLPSGRTWAQALGWRNIFGMPFVLHQQRLVAVGVEHIIAHQRGATPVMNAYIYRAEEFPSSEVAEFADALDGGVGVNEVSPTHGILKTKATTPTQHFSTEARILRHASASYSQGGKLLFATMLLCEDRLKTPGFPGPYKTSASAKSPSGLKFDSYLIATTSVITSTFSPLARAWLTMYKNIA